MHKAATAGQRTLATDLEGNAMAVKLNASVKVARSIGAVNEKTGKQGTPTEDGKEHNAVSVLPSLVLKTNDAKGFGEAVAGLLACGVAVNALEPVTLVLKSGATKDLKPVLNYVDGAGRIVAGDSGVIPADYSELAKVIDVGMQYMAAGKLTAFLAKFKAGGAASGGASKEIDEGDNIA